MKTTTQQRNQVNCHKVVEVNNETGEILMLDYLFDDGDGFKGAVGTSFQAITQDEIDQRLDPDYIQERYKEIWQQVVEAGNTELGLREWCDELEPTEETEFDLSYMNHWPELRKYGFSEEDYPIFECIGGGRCFGKDFKGNKNPKLCALIRQYEA